MASRSPRAHAIAFGAIWTALALYVLALVRHARAPALAGIGTWAHAVIVGM